MNERVVLSKKMIIDTHTELYRYDLEKPPDKWDSDFLNFEYQTEEYGHKNKAKLFFFSDSKQTVRELGLNAAIKYNRTKYYFTKANTILPVKVIDFDNRHNIYQMLCLLSDLGIQVLTNDFKTYEEDKTFGELKIHFDKAELEEDTIKKMNIIPQMKVHTNSDYENIGLFGQRLTDFDNGLYFKKLVKSIDSQIDGYRWWEFNKKSFTYCLFDCEKLSEKETEIISL